MTCFFFISYVILMSLTYFRPCNTLYFIFFNQWRQLKSYKWAMNGLHVRWWHIQVFFFTIVKQIIFHIGFSLFIKIRVFIITGEDRHKRWMSQVKKFGFSEHNNVNNLWHVCFEKVCINQTRVKYKKQIIFLWKIICIIYLFKQESTWWKMEDLLKTFQGYLT